MAEHRDRVSASAESAAPDGAIRDAIGYRVLGPEGDVGAIVGVPEAGRPLRPLVLVVRGRDTMRFVSLRRVAAVRPAARLLLLHPEMGPSPDGGFVQPRRRSAYLGQRPRRADHERADERR